MYYIYGIEHDLAAFPLYIGMTDNPERRFSQHVERNVKLYKELQPLRDFAKQMQSDLNPPQIEARLEIYAQTPILEEARELERIHIQSKGPILNIQHNEENRAYYISSQFIYDINRLFEEAGIPDEQANKIIMKLLPLIKRDGWSLKAMKLIGEE